jgi:hypothetical protein
VSISWGSMKRRKGEYVWDYACAIGLGIVLSLALAAFVELFR